MHPRHWSLRGCTYPAGEITLVTSPTGLWAEFPAMQPRVVGFHISAKHLARALRVSKRPRCRFRVHFSVLVTSRGRDGTWVRFELERSSQPKGPQCARPALSLQILSILKHCYSALRHSSQLPLRSLSWSPKSLLEPSRSRSGRVLMSSLTSPFTI